MREAGRAGIGEVAFGGREHLVALEAPRESTKLGLMAYLLRNHDELRASHDYFLPAHGVKVHTKELAMAGELIAKYTAPFRQVSFQDNYEDALRALLAAKQKKESLPVSDVKRQPAPVLNLMDALRDRVRQTKHVKAGKGRANGPVLVHGARRKHRAA